MSLMLAEALEAPARVRDLLALDREVLAALVACLDAADPAFAATVARGSSDHAAGYGAYLLGCLWGRVTASLPPSLVTLEQARLRLRDQFVLAVSQSGRGPDVIEVTRAARAAGAVTLALVNDAASPLADTAEFVLPQHAGPEHSVAATKSVIASLASLARLAALLGRDPALEAALHALPDVLEAAAHAGDALPDDWLGDVAHVFVLARGAGLAVAHEVALKLKETVAVQAEAFSAAEVRHGPREAVDARFAVLALIPPGPAATDVHAAADELAGQGAKIIRVAAEDEATVPLPTAPHPLLAPIVGLQALYPLIARAAVARCRDPDRPATLLKVTKTF